jgi:hypothetical protein
MHKFLMPESSLDSESLIAPESCLNLLAAPIEDLNICVTVRFTLIRDMTTMETLLQLTARA